MAYKDLSLDGMVSQFEKLMKAEAVHTGSDV